MPNLTCRSCGGTNVRYSANLVLHLYRKLIKSNKRRCLECMYKWREPDQKRSLAYFVLLLGGAGLSLAAVSQWYAQQTGRKLLARHGSRQNAQDPARPLLEAEENQFDQTFSEQGTEQESEKISGSWWQKSIEGRGQASSDWGAPPAETWAGAPRSEQKGLLSNFSLSADIMLKLLKGRSKKEIVQELETSDKKALWNKYGQYFSSKEEAKKTYDEYKRKKASGEFNEPDRPAP